MSFIDELIIKVEAGSGGSGCISFHRDKTHARGAPDGGNGGRGGHIYLQTSDQLNTLKSIKNQSYHRAENGSNGSSAKKTGRSGKDVTILVPVGTRVFDAESLDLIIDLTEADQSYQIASGGHPGVGNHAFKTSTNRSPKFKTNGSEGEFKHLLFHLHLMADIGLMGLPNAGKSTFLSVISEARPKVANYPFTTLSPILGTISSHAEHLIIADMPGLIKGASEGTGLGFQFLKHLSRTKMLFHLVEINPSPEIILHNINLINNEVKQYSETLLSIPQWIIVTKKELVSSEEITHIEKTLKNTLTQPIFFISSLCHLGLDELLTHTYQTLPNISTIDRTNLLKDIERLTQRENKHD